VLVAEPMTNLEEAIDGLGICFSFLLCVLRVDTGCVAEIFICFYNLFI
jgi:hypothetical protein